MRADIPDGKRARRLGYSHGFSQPDGKCFDVIVVGSGCAGLTTAVVAAKHGLNVLVLEKSHLLGGTTAYSGGGAWIPNTKHQSSLEVKDCIPQAKTYLREVLGKLYEAEKIDAFLDSGPKMVDFMEANSTVRFKPVPLPDYYVHKQGASIGRTILTEPFDGRKLGSLVKLVRYPVQGYSAFGTMQAEPAEMSVLTDPFGSASNFVYAIKKMLRYIADLVRFGKGTSMANGNALIGRLLYSCKMSGVDLWTKSEALKAVMIEGRVAGMEILCGDKKMTMYARRGVVLASGGFGRSKEAEEYVPHQWCASSKGSTGDGKKIGAECGGALPQKNPTNAIFAPISLLRPSRGPIRRYPPFSIDRTKPGSIIVGPDGRRFANESEPYHDFVTTMHERKIETAYYVGDHTHLRKYGMGMALPWPYPIWMLIHQGYLITAPNISELAQKIKVPVDNLEQTISDCNSFARHGKDLQFQRGENSYDTFYGDPNIQPNSSLGECTKSPFYALPLYPGNVSTTYGLLTNADAQVLNQKGEVIKGLFAVGCDQNSVFKGTYPGGGSSIGPGMTFGFRAGQKLANIKD